MQVRPKGGSAIDGTYSTTQHGIVNFSPARVLEKDKQHEIFLKMGGVTDAAGNGLSEDVLISFSTGSASSTSARAENTISPVVQNRSAKALFSTGVVIKDKYDLKGRFGNRPPNTKRFYR